MNILEKGCGVCMTAGKKQTDLHCRLCTSQKIVCSGNICIQSMPTSSLTQVANNLKVPLLPSRYVTITLQLIQQCFVLTSCIHLLSALALSWKFL